MHHRQMSERAVSLIAGFDAGQTHTSCRLADAGSCRVLAEGTGPGVCHLAAPEGPRRFQEALSGSLRHALAQLTAHGPEARQEAPSLAGGLAAAAVGASGIEIGTAVQRQGLELAAAAVGLPPERVWVGGDERTALRGAFPDGPGIVVISGTGTIAVGRDGMGREHRCAGWGWILDGAGSAFDIGRDALAISLQMADGRRREGLLRQRLWQALELDLQDPEAPQVIKARVVQAGFAPAGLAALAPVVAVLAGEGDADAVELLCRHAEALAASVVGVAQALELSAPSVAALGGAIRHLGCFHTQFVQALAQRLPAARLQQPAGDALSGALAMAAELQPGGAARC